MRSLSTIFTQNFDIEASNTKPNHFSIIFLDKKIQLGIVRNL